MNSFKGIAIILVSVKVLLHLSVLLVEGYGIFRDELYYIANTEHLAFGYVDHPPLSVWLLDAFTTFSGDSWQAIRVLAAIIGGLTMYGLLRLTRSLGGNLVACWIAGIAFLFAPINNAYSSYFSMNVLDMFFWVFGFLALLKALNQPNRTVRWAILGVVIGAGLLNKISISWFAIGMVLFLLISPYRKLLLIRGPYVAGAVALALFLPFILWNVQHDMAHLEFALNASEFKYAGISRSDFLIEQLILEHPFILVLLIASGGFLFSKNIQWQNKAPVIIFLITICILLLKGHVKAEYMAGAYTAIFSSGAVWLSEAASKVWQRALLLFFIIAYSLTGIFILPLAVPVLPEEDFINYSQTLGLEVSNSEGKEESSLPQFFADMHGWENMARTVSEVYLQIPESDRSRVVAWVNNYGEAGALDYYRDQYPLPPVLSAHNSYYHWGQELLENNSYDVFIIIGGSPDGHREYLGSVFQAGIIQCTYCMPYENNLPIFIGRDPRGDITLKALLESEKNFN
jgi:hypothetical protein